MRTLAIIIIALLAMPVSSFAWASVAARGTQGNKVSGTGNLALTVSGTVSVDNVLVCIVGGDNIQTGDSETTDFSLADSQSNTYTKSAEWTNGNASAGTGVTTAVFYSKISTELTGSSDTVTLTTGTAITAKGIVCHEFSLTDSSYTITTDGYGGSSKDGSSSPSKSLSGLENREHLFVFASTDERQQSTNSLTQDGDYTALAKTGSDGSTGDTNITISGGYRVATLTADTYSGTWALSGDLSDILVALDEDGAPAAGSSGFPAGIEAFP